MLLDNIRIVPGLAEPPVPLGMSFAPNNTVRVAWPVDATDYLLQTAPKVTGPWSPSQLIVVIEGNENVAYDQTGAGNLFYRLVK